MAEAFPFQPEGQEEEEEAVCRGGAGGVHHGLQREGEEAVAGHLQEEEEEEEEDAVLPGLFHSEAEVEQVAVASCWPSLLNFHDAPQKLIYRRPKHRMGVGGATLW